MSADEHERLLQLFSRAGLSIDHPDFDEDVLDRGTQAILKTRDGLLRAVVPSPLGDRVFLNDCTKDELAAALREHKKVVQEFPRKGMGVEAFVDAGDSGDAAQGSIMYAGSNQSEGLRKIKVLNDDTVPTNGSASPVTNGLNSSSESEEEGPSTPDDVDMPVIPGTKPSESVPISDGVVAS